MLTVDFWTIVKLALVAAYALFMVLAYSLFTRKPPNR